MKAADATEKKKGAVVKAATKAGAASGKAASKRPAAEDSAVEDIAVALKRPAAGDDGFVPDAEAALKRPAADDDDVVPDAECQVISKPIVTKERAKGKSLHNFKSNCHHNGITSAKRAGYVAGRAKFIGKFCYHAAKKSGFCK